MSLTRSLLVIQKAEKAKTTGCFERKLSIVFGRGHSIWAFELFQIVFLLRIIIILIERDLIISTYMQNCLPVHKLENFPF